ncbi:hypothetical protein Glove_682g35 [Diversispora epigaea]|uniref:Uncharacterized protein n=1 Tax=Diversispora epigaea TaxID=1348612 RepID=A0A397G2S1_9GLOM|nr:hypothetical protein Glove_682g35 [Diversispora epigaea]
MIKNEGKKEGWKDGRKGRRIEEEEGNEGEKRKYTRISLRQTRQDIWNKETNAFFTI